MLGLCKEAQTTSPKTLLAEGDFFNLHISFGKSALTKANVLPDSLDASVTLILFVALPHTRLRSGCAPITRDGDQL